MIKVRDIIFAKALGIGGGSGGAKPVIEALTVTENGIYSPPAGVEGFSPVEVIVDSGGGGEFTYGEFTIPNTSYPGVSMYEIEHGLGESPKFFLLYTTRISGRESTQKVLQSMVVEKPGITNSRFGSIAYTTPYMNPSGDYDATINIQQGSAAFGTSYAVTFSATTVKFDFTAEGVFIPNGITYRWIAMKV